MAELASIPVIDISGLNSGESAAVHSIARSVHEACTDTGFFYVSDHGVPAHIIHAAVDAVDEFFHLPEQEKQAVAANSRFRGYNAVAAGLMDGAEYPDHKQFFQIGLDLPEDDPEVLAGKPLRGPNVWPDRPTAFREATSMYFEEAARVGADLLTAVAVGFGLDAAFFADRYRKRMQRTNFTHYPAQPADAPADHFGIAPHSDFGCITVLHQDSTSGLELLAKNGDWVAAPPIEGTLVINIGDLLERWTNNRFVSTKHRARNPVGCERISIATFYDPDFDVIVDPRDLDPSGAIDPIFEPVAAGEHIAGRIQRSFGYGGTV